MDARHVVHACSNHFVAGAALVSIGGDIMEAVASEADRRRLGSGPFAARLVQDFARRARDEDWARADEATRGVDLPVLSCFRFILDHGLAATRSH